MARQFRCPRCDNLHPGIHRSPGALSVVCIRCVPVKTRPGSDRQPAPAPAGKRVAAKRKKVSR